MTGPSTLRRPDRYRTSARSSATGRGTLPATGRGTLPGTGRGGTSRSPGRRSSARSGWTAPTLVAAGPLRVRLPLGARRAPFVLLVTGLLVGGLCALLALNTATAAAELSRQHLAVANTDLAADVQALRVDLANRRAPAALARAAARLGMVPDTTPGYLTVRADGRVDVVGNPQPATRPPLPPEPRPAARSSRVAPKRAKAAPPSSAPLPGGPR